MNSIGKSFVTQQMVAGAAGVHYSTVSLALRNDARLSTATRRRVKAVAKRLGYAPNPLISLLMARVRNRGGDYRGTLAYVHTVPTSDPRLSQQVYRNFLVGAKTRAGQLGYKIDEFFLGDEPAGGRRIAKVFQARGIAGLIIENMSGGICTDRCLPFDTAPFAAVSLATPLARPQLHYIANDQYMRAILAARELLRLGYRRLGMISIVSLDVAMDHRCTAGFLAVREYIPEVGSAPILRLPVVPDLRDRRELRDWLRRHRPDAILGMCHTALNAIKECGLRVPEDVGWAHLDWMPRFKPTAGVHGNSEHTGTAAAELVVSQLYRGELGPPAHAMSYLVAGSWMPGETVRRVGPPLDLDTSFFADLLRT